MKHLAMRLVCVQRAIAIWVAVSIASFNGEVLARTEPGQLGAAKVPMTSTLNNGLAIAEIVVPVRMPEVATSGPEVVQQYTTSVRLAKCPDREKRTLVRCVTIIRNLE
jgi:hypothetical protein